jgi:peptidyl-prolyl cis-trans isomerase-like 3
LIRRIFCDTVHKASFNFLALAASGYYNNTLFLRNIKGFMVQGGDPTGTGKGGESIWGGTFIDEFHSDLKHDKRGIVSMANNGPDSNGSQFFISYSAQPHLNNQYTIIGQVNLFHRFVFFLFLTLLVSRLLMVSKF